VMHERLTALRQAIDDLERAILDKRQNGPP
jgi:hypothetical protein